MENKFKVGDRVRIIKSYHGAPYDVGDVGAILWHNEAHSEYIIAFDTLKGHKVNPSDYGSHWYTVSKRLEFENQLMRFY